MLILVYVDSKEEKRIVSIKPKPAFKPLFQIALTRTDSGVVILKDEDDDSENGAKPLNIPKSPKNNKTLTPDADARESNPCLWWRRGRVELLPTHGIYVKLAA